ncbi:MAG: Ribonuclease Y [Mycoplasmataceae bacterium]|nr:MAG: Ribonuclease Y [Mycoplasmataceae bacterium]
MIETLLIWLAEPVVASLVKWAIGATVTYFLAKPAIERFGSTPANRANDLGITQEDALDYANKNRKEKLEHAKQQSEELNKELKEENEKLKENIKKLEQRLLTETEDWKNEQDEGERKRKFAVMQNTKGELDSARGQLKKNEQEIKNSNKKVLDMYDELSKGAEKLTIEQFKAKNNRPDLGYWSTWIILAIAVISAVMAVKFIFGLFKKLGKEI